MTKDTGRGIGLTKGKPYQPSAAKLPDGMRVKAPTVDLAGQKFGKLTAIRVVGKHKSGSLLWLCKCDCGNITEKPSGKLKFTKGVISCGCFNSEHKRAYYQREDAWNLGKTYTTKAVDYEYKNTKSWGHAVKRANGFICERCGWDEGRCDVHHRIPKSEGGKNTIKNGIVLCPNCHRLAHEKKWKPHPLKNAEVIVCAS